MAKEISHKNMKSSARGALYTYLIVQLLAIVLGYPSVASENGFNWCSAVNAIGVSYMILSFTICLPFSLLGFIFQGEQPLNPWGFAISACLSIFLITLIYSLERFLPDNQKGRKCNPDGSRRRFIFYIALLLFLASIAYPFFVSLDFF